MSVAPGTRLGHYEIIELIAAGGMGEVYKALDPRLNRTVAVKILHEHISDSPEARVRFEREAQTIARLNNPHICVIYDVGRHEKMDFLVMELLDGETLARRLDRGPLPLDQALRYAAEIAEALDKVHRQGITHREELTRLDRAKGEVSHRAPQILPGGKTLLFTVWTGPGSDERHLHVHLLATGAHHELVRGASSGHYVASGHLLYSRAGALMAVPFDLASLKVTGSPVAMAERAVDIETACFAVSDSGILAYVPVSPHRDERRLVWVDGSNVTPLPVMPGAFFEPSISPDGEYAAVTRDGPVEGIWILEFRRNTLSPFTSTSQATSQAPVWTRDGKRIAYRGTRTGFRNIYWKTVDGGTAEEKLTTSDNNQTPGSFSPQDKQLTFSEIDLATGGDIWTLSLDKSRNRVEFQRNSTHEVGPVISPDGNWLAYTSSESGTREIYVLPFPGPGGKKTRISTDGGTEAVWSHSQRELYFRNGDKMMAINVSQLPDRVGPARAVFEGQYTFTDTGRPGYDVGKDGRFLMIQPVEPEQPATQMNLVLDWFDELKRLDPGN